jgi:hypothetical protein
MTADNNGPYVNTGLELSSQLIEVLSAAIGDALIGVHRRFPLYPGENARKSNGR